MRVERNGATFVFNADPTGDRLRVALLSSDDPHHLYLLSELAGALDVCGAVIEPSAAQQRALRRPGKRVDRLARLWQVRRQRVTGRSRYRHAYFDPLTKRDRIETIPKLVVPSVNDPAAAAWLRALQPDVTVVCGTTFIREATLEAAGLAINVHCGHLPDYRGNHCIFFACLNDDYDKIAATVHVVTSRLDGGDVLDVVHCDVFPHDNDEHLYCRAVHAGIERVRDLLVAFELGAALVARPQSHEGAVYRHRDRTPAREVALWLRRRRHAVPHLRRPHPLPAEDRSGLVTERAR